MLPSTTGYSLRLLTNVCFIYILVRKPAEKKPISQKQNRTEKAIFSETPKSVFLSHLNTPTDIIVNCSVTSAVFNHWLVRIQFSPCFFNRGNYANNDCEIWCRKRQWWIFLLQTTSAVCSVTRIWQCSTYIVYRYSLLQCIYPSGKVNSAN